MVTRTIVTLPGQGIGPEIVDATCEVLMGTGLPLKILTPAQDNPLPEETKRAAREADGVLFGAAGPATIHVRPDAHARPGRQGQDERDGAGCSRGVSKRLRRLTARCGARPARSPLRRTS